jgi:hypothetical protein
MRPYIACSLRRVGQLSIALACGLSACSPALNWREIHPPDSGVIALFPCKPDHHTRRVTLAGTALAMQLSSCTAADSVYALSHIDVGQAVRVTPVLQGLRQVAAENIGGPTAVSDLQPVPGMTPHPLAQRLGWRGTRPDGSVIAAQAMFFTQGTHVYQATVVGTRLDAVAVDTFFAALKLP